MPSQIPWDSGELQRLVTDPGSRIYRESKRVSLVLKPFHLQDLKSAVHEILSGSIDRYDNKWDGILLKYENLKITSDSGCVTAETSEIVLEIQADFYIFRPEVKCILKGVVNKISKDHVGVLLYKRFNVSCHRPLKEKKSLTWLGNQVQMHQEVTFKLKEKNFATHLPYFQGTLLSCGNVLTSTMTDGQEISKKNKKSKKSLEGLEAFSTSTPLNEKSLKSKKSQDDTKEVKNDPKKRKLEVISKELSPVGITPKQKKKKISTGSVDEVDFFPKSTSNESFLTKSVLPDQFLSPMANSTHFDVGKIMSSQKKIKEHSKKSKSKVGGLSDIREEQSNSNKTSSIHSNAFQSMQEGNVFDAGKKKKSKKIEADPHPPILLEEHEDDSKVKKAHKKEKKTKKRADSPSNVPIGSLSSEQNLEKKHKHVPIPSLTPDPSINALKDSSEDTRKSAKKDKKKKSSDPLVSFTDLSTNKLEKMCELKGKTKKNDKTIQDESSITCNTKYQPGSEISLPAPHKKKKKSHEIERGLTQDNQSSPAKSKSKSLKIDPTINNLSSPPYTQILPNLNSENDSPRRRKDAQIAITEEPPSKKSKKTSSVIQASLKENTETKPSAPADKRNLLSFMYPNLDQNVTSARKEEILSPSKKKKKSRESSDISLKTGGTQEESKSSLKSKGKQTHTPDPVISDFALDDLIPPGQKIMSGSPQKTVLSSRSSFGNDPVGFFPSSSLIALDSGIQKGHKISPLMFGGTQPNIPPPSDTSDSDSPKSKNVGTASLKSPSHNLPVVKSPVKASVPARSSSSSSDSESDSPFPSKLNALKSCSPSNMMIPAGSPLNSKTRKITSGASNDNFNISSKEGDMFTVKTSSKLVPPPRSPLKLISSKTKSYSSSSDSDTEPEKANTSKLLSSSKPVNSKSKYLSTVASKSVPPSSSSTVKSPLAPKKVVVTGAQSDSDSSMEEAGATSSLQGRRNAQKGTSSYSVSKSEGKQMANRFLESMGVIQSPLTTTPMPEHESSESDIDSFESDHDSPITHKKQKESLATESPSKEYPPGGMVTTSSSKKKQAQKNKLATVDSKAPRRKAKSTTHISEKESAVKEDIKGREVSKNTQSVPADSKTKPKKKQLSKPASYQKPAIDDSSDDEYDLELMRAAALALQKKNSEIQQGVEKTTSKKASHTSKPHVSITPILSNNKGKCSEALAPESTKQKVKQTAPKKAKNTSKSKASSLALTSLSSNIPKKVAVTDGSSDSDPGPDDRNTTASLEQHRMEQLSKEQQKVTKQKKKEAKTLKEIFKSPSKPPSLAVDSETNLPLKDAKRKAKPKKHAECDDELKDVIRRLMQMRQAEVDGKK